MKKLVEIKNVCKIYNPGENEVRALDHVSLTIGEREFVAIAVATEKFLGWPCGICRQALYEFAPDLQVIVACGDLVDTASLRELLPHGFGAVPDVLGRE